jgi:hypothetical protein
LPLCSLLVPSSLDAKFLLTLIKPESLTFVNKEVIFAGKLAGITQIIIDIPRLINIFSIMNFTPIQFFPSSGPTTTIGKAGFRFGDKGTHTSRTIMFDELSLLFKCSGPGASRAEYATLIIEQNCLAKSTASTRRLTNQRLGELYALNLSVPIFRVLRRLWDINEQSRPLLALTCALARDPLLTASAPVIVSLSENAEFLRDPLKEDIRNHVGDRLKDATIDKVVRNIASSWSQSGHLDGRTFKKRRRVEPSPVNVAYSLFIGYMAGFRGEDLFSSGWIAVLDCSPPAARELALNAKRMGLIDMKTAGEVTEINLSRLDQEGGTE